MATDKRKKTIRNAHKYEYKQRMKRLKKALERSYLKLRAQNPELSERELDALFIEQQRKIKASAKEKYENKQAKHRETIRAKNAKSKPSKNKAQSVRTVQGGGVSPR